MERERIQGLPKFFWVPPIISGTGKATNFNFCTHILSIDRNKSLLQISGKVAGCVVRTLKTFQGTHMLGASRGVLCASSAVLFKSLSMMTSISPVTSCASIATRDAIRSGSVQTCSAIAISIKGWLNRAFVDNIVRVTRWCIGALYFTIFRCIRLRKVTENRRKCCRHSQLSSMTSQRRWCFRC